MKKLLLFALLSSVPAFGQAYSDSVTQNSPGNYGRPVPFASVLVCQISDTATPCTTKVNTFTDDGLGTACTQTASSGVLTGAPSSGANCNNPGIADANGNFTIYVVPGQYRICTYANNWLCQNVSIGGSGGGIPFACPSAVNGSIVAMTSTTTSSCDPNGVTDFIGHWTSQSYRATGAFNGTVELTGGLADPTNPPDTNSVAFLAPLTVPTPYYLRPSSSAGTVGQLVNLASQTISTNGTIDALGWLNAVITINGTACNVGSTCTISTGTTQVIQVNGTPITTESPANFQNTSGVSWSNPSAGNIQVTVSGIAPTQASNPSAPTVTPQGTPGATTYCYKIVGNERFDFSVQSAASAQGCTSTGNATLTSVNSNLLTAYADTLYGYRNLSVYRVTGGATQGLIAAGVGKKFTDTGLAGDGSTPTAVNTTALDQHCLGSANPVGINVIPGAPCGIDAPPTSPNALDDEMGASFGAPGDVNNTAVWTWVNQGSCTATWTSGMLSMSCPTDGGAAYHCLVTTAPGTPYTFHGLLYWNSVQTSNEVGALIAGIAFRESSTAKVIMMGPYTQNANHPAEVSVSRYTNATTVSSQSPVGVAGTATNPYVFGIQNTGTNTVYTSSPDGSVFSTIQSEAKNTFFTTGPDQVGMCMNAFGGAATLQIDYFRRTQ